MSMRICVAVVSVGMNVRMVMLKGPIAMPRRSGPIPLVAVPVYVYVFA